MANGSTNITEQYDMLITWHSALKDTAAKTILNGMLNNSGAYVGSYIKVSNVPAEKTADCNITAEVFDKDAIEIKDSSVKSYTIEDEVTLATPTKEGQIGNNLRQIDGELDKLKLFAYPNDTVTVPMVREICISNEDLFAFSDFLMENQKDRALLEYRKLLDTRYPLEILSTLQTMLRRWIILKAKAQSATPMELSRMTGMHEYVVKLNLQKLKKTNLKDLVRLKENLAYARKNPADRIYLI